MWLDKMNSLSGRGYVTGSIVFLSGNLLTATMLKYATTCRWNHAGILVCLDEYDNIVPQSDNYSILEINTDTRYDIHSEDHIEGIGITPLQDILHMYHTIAVRPIRREYTHSVMDNINRFVKDTKQIKFNSVREKFIAAWLGLGHKGHDDMMFCTEVMAYFYQDCFGIPIADILQVNNVIPSSCLPIHYTPDVSADSKIFRNYMDTIQYKKDWLLRSVYVVPMTSTVAILLILLFLFLLK